VSRIYAGVLGLLAFLISLLRGMLHGYGTDSVLATACGSTLLLAVVGLAIGRFAQWIVEDSVNSRLAAEVAAQQAAAPTPPAAKKAGA
jgi:hypothetical protein